MTKKQRVIYAWNYVEWGGAQIHFLALVKEARKHFDVLVVMPVGTDTQFLRFLGQQNIAFELFEGNIDLEPKTGVVDKLVRHVKRIKSEYAMLQKLRSVGLQDSVVHTDISPGQSLFSLIWLCLRTDVFLTFHNAIPEVQWWRYRIWKIKYGIISRLDSIHVFCTNEHAAEYFKRLFSHGAGSNIKVTYDSVDPDELEAARTAEFDRSSALHKLGIPTDSFIVLTVGQFVDRKGRRILMEAVRSVRELRPDIRFIWVTQSFPAGDIELVGSYDLGSTFRLVRSDEIGEDRASLLKFFRVADIFALPSYVEGVPIALLEAMGLGLPCISTNVYGIPEAISDGETGILIEPGSTDQLTASILSLYGDSDLRSRLGIAARQTAVSKFDQRIAARTAVDSYIQAFRRINDQPPNRPFNE